VFFFEKKNKNNFIFLAPHRAPLCTTQSIRAQEQKFFGSFFQKITLLPSAFPA
jgi:hypothetical protein